MSRRKTVRVKLDEVRPLSQGEATFDVPPNSPALDEVPVCIVCRQPVNAYGPWTAFSVADRPIVYACSKHAPVVRQAIVEAAHLAAVGVKQLFESKFPGLLDRVREATALTAELLHLWRQPSEDPYERN